VVFDSFVLLGIKVIAAIIQKERVRSYRADAFSYTLNKMPRQDVS